MISCLGPKQVNAEVNIEQELILTCPFMGDPMPKITWYKHNQPIEFDLQSNYRIEGSGGKLIITQVRNTDNIL